MFCVVIIILLLSSSKRKTSVEKSLPSATPCGLFGIVSEYLTISRNSRLMSSLVIVMLAVVMLAPAGNSRLMLTIGSDAPILDALVNIEKDGPVNN